MKFLLGVLFGSAVGVLASWQGAGPPPRAAVPREAAAVRATVRAAVPAARTVDSPAERAIEPAARAARPFRCSPARIQRLLASRRYVDALRAADLLAREGRDVAHLEWAYREAVVRIDRHVAGEPGAVVIEALRAVCRNRIAWRREALDAARSLAARGRCEVAVCAADTVEHLRTRVVPLVNR